MTFGTQGSKTEWSPNLLPESWNPEAVFEHGYLFPCHRKWGEGGSISGGSVSRGLIDVASRRKDKGFRGEQKSSALKPCPHHRATALSRTCQPAHVRTILKSYFWLLGRLGCYFLCPRQPAGPAPLSLPPPHCRAPSAIRLYLYR